MHGKLLTLLILVLFLIGIFAGGYYLYKAKTKEPPFFVSITSNIPNLPAVQINDRAVWEEFLSEIGFYETNEIYQISSKEDQVVKLSVPVKKVNIELIDTPLLTSKIMVNEGGVKIEQASREVTFDKNNHILTLKIYINPKLIPSSSEEQSEFITGIVGFMFIDISRLEVRVRDKDAINKSINEKTAYLGKLVAENRLLIKVIE